MCENTVERPILSAKAPTGRAAASRRQAIETDFRRESHRQSRTSAYELNQTLTAISAGLGASLQWLTPTDPNVPDAVAAIGGIVADVERATAIIRRTYALTGNTKPQTSRMDYAIDETQTIDRRTKTNVNWDLWRESRTDAFVAHEVNQPFTAIAIGVGASMRWLKRTDPNVPEAIAVIHGIVADVERAAAIIRRTYGLAGNMNPQMSRLDINDVIDEAIVLAGNQAFNRPVFLRFQGAADLPPVQGDAVLLQQLVLNLAVNGMEAMEAVVAPELMIRTRRYDSQMVLVTVEDAGAGTDCDDLERLFSTFFTTKFSGMGMGLALSRVIVEAHSGRIWAVRNPGPGMTFQFTIPVSSE